MRNIKTGLWLFLVLGFASVAQANIDKTNQREKPASPSHDQYINFREACDNATSQIEQEFNNVRARLLTGGDVWWDGDNGRYVVPKTPPGVPEVSAIFAGAVWLGGLDPGGNLKVAAQTYGRSGGNFDFWPGPLQADGPDIGTTSQDTCAKWDRFFVVKGENIKTHINNYLKAVQAGQPYDPQLIPEDVRGWPGRGNPFFTDVHHFELPTTDQGLAGFYDADGDMIYNPEFGDYPVIEIRGCEAPQYPDEMIFWIYNDNGNVHSESQGSRAIQMEVQVQAFSYKTNDEINNMTFQRYKLINRATEDIQQTYFAMWADPDLGCYTDDYIGCDTTRSLGFVYNQDALDGTTGCSCDQGVNSYCDDVPILGIDYFRGPLNENMEEIGMSSFTYYNNGSSTPTPPTGTTDPGNAQEYYNYLSGKWKDGSPFTFGGDGHFTGSPIKFAFPNAPNDQNGWSMCSAGLPVSDRRFVEASGPFLLKPGAVNELIVGMVWVADQVYPCPSIRKLQEADDVAQALFDNCFELTRGPDAPDVDFIELDREIIAVFSNDTTGRSNNAHESYAGKGLRIPEGVADSFYLYEGYKLFQLAGPEVSLADQDDPSKVRLVYQVDIKNGVGKIFNWKGLSPEDGTTPTTVEYFVPELQVDGADLGIKHTFRITEDQFAQDNRRMINHKKYYFVAVAYAFNEYEAFDPADGVGQRLPYLEGDGNIGDGENGFYTVIPRPVVDRKLNAGYGDGVTITRIEGVGVGGNFLDITDDTRTEIESTITAGGNFSGNITYKDGRGPINVFIYNPLDVKDGEFELTFVDENMANDKLDNQVKWTLKNLSEPGSPIIAAEETIDKLNEQIVAQYGFSVAIGQTKDVGQTPLGTNGAIGAEIEYKGAEPTQWLLGIKDETNLGTGLTLDNSIFDFVATELGDPDYDIDPNQQLSNIGGGPFIPYYMADWRSRPDDNPQPYITPAWTTVSGNYNNIARGQMKLVDVPNVDIVFTSNKDLWSRCVVIETANRYYGDAGFLTEGNVKHFDLRGAPSVTKFDNDNDGKPDVDPNEAVPGMGWFPGYAIDVETGQRLDIFFGENSTYNGDFIPEANNGADMMFNPSGTLFSPPQSGNIPSIYNYVAGGQHFFYVAKTPYSECALFKDRLAPNPNLTRKVLAVKEIVWTGLVVSPFGLQLKSYADGLIPTDVTVKLRVDNPYQNKKVSGEYNGYPTYRFKIEGKQADAIDTEPEIDNALNQINVVPNPYYGFSDYEDASFENTIKITNLPARCVVTIFSLDGKFIRQYTRDEIGADPKGYGVLQQQVSPALEWDLKNSKGIPVASGIYLIHVKAEGLGERTIKWFGVNRQFDTLGL